MKARIPESLDEFQRGDIVRHFSEAKSWVVMGNYGTHVIAVRHQSITNPQEWVILEPERKEP